MAFFQSLAVKKCARETIKIIVISPYTGIFEYLIMKISDTPGEQISGLSRYTEARAVHYIAQKLRVKLGAINKIVLLGDNIIDCGSATVSRDVKPGREISIWEVMQLPKSLLGFIGYNELKECTSIVPGEATAKDRVLNAVEYSLETVIKDSKFMKYLTEPEQKAIMKRILYKEARRKKEEEMEKVKDEQELYEEEGYEEEYVDTYKEYLRDIEGEDAIFAKDLEPEGAFGEQIPETKYLTSEGINQSITETEMEETTLEDIYKGEQDIDEYKEDYFLDHEGFDRDEYRSLFKHLIEEEEIAIREEPPDTRPLISDSFEQLMAKLREKPLEEDDSLKAYPGLKKAIMKAVEDDAWCKYSLLKLVENDGPPYGYALASSFLRHFKRIIQGSEKISSMIAMSDGSYQIPEGIFAAFPVKICGFSKRIEIVKDIDIFTVTMNRINQFVHKQRRIYCFIDHIIEEEGLPEVERLPETSTDEDMTDAEGTQVLSVNIHFKEDCVFPLGPRDRSNKSLVVFIIIKTSWKHYQFIILAILLGIWIFIYSSFLEVNSHLKFIVIADCNVRLGSSQILPEKLLIDSLKFRAKRVSKDKVLDSRSFMNHAQ